jgi:hypothetical protein
MAALRHALWIGGPPGSGKTSIAKRIARRHGLRWYSADAYTWQHRDRALLAGNDAARRWEELRPEERRTQPTPEEQLAMSLHFERGPMIVDDVRRLPRSPLIIAEGSPVSPAVVSSNVAERSRAVWLQPTPDFLRRKQRRTSEFQDLLRATIEREAREHGAPMLSVDGSRDVEQMVVLMEERFAEALAAGPRARTLPERRKLLREANTMVVSQCLDYLARPWSQGAPETFVRAFICECDDPECTAVVEIPLAAAGNERLLASGHA